MSYSFLINTLTVLNLKSLWKVEACQQNKICFWLFKYLLKYLSYMPDATAKRHCSSHSQNLAEKKPQEYYTDPGWFYL